MCFIKSAIDRAILGVGKGLVQARESLGSSLCPPRAILLGKVSNLPGHGLFSALGRVCGLPLVWTYLLPLPLIKAGPGLACVIRALGTEPPCPTLKRVSQSVSLPPDIRVGEVPKDGLVQREETGPSAPVELSF